MNAPDARFPQGTRKESRQGNIRIFIAVTLPDHVACWLSEIQEELKACGLPVQWTRTGNIHLTLKFLGEIPAQDIAGVCQAVGASAGNVGSLEIFAKGIGVFPGVKRPRVLWTGISGRTDLLGDLHQNMDAALHALGFPKDERAFTGHLTIGRFKTDRRPHGRGAESIPELLIEIIKKYQSIASSPFLADAIHVFKSDLTPKGPIYTNLSTVRLSGGVESLS